MTHEAPRPRIAVRSLGGTIAMTTGAGAGGARPTVDAATLVAAVPRLADVAAIDAASLLSLPSPSLDIVSLLRVITELDATCSAGADGVVVTTGTDSLEEVAYLFHLLWRRPEPLVVTGAMRTADAPSADGPANLLGAVTVAASAEARERGCLVVMNDEVHAADVVRKTHTTSVAAFQSPGRAPVGRVHEGAALLEPRVPRGRIFAVPPEPQVPAVGLVRVALGADTVLVERAVEVYDGLVVEAMGGGHVPSWWEEVLVDAAARVPVVLASRTGEGSALTSTYGFVGSERPLLDAGLLPAGSLDGLKARVLLTVALMSSRDRREVEAAVSAGSRRRSPD
jgi:L-asparaginase